MIKRWWISQPGTSARSHRPGTVRLGTAILALVGALVASVLPVPAAAEQFPDYVFGSAAIPPGLSNQEVFSRFITPASTIFLTVDTTNWPGSDLAIPGIKVNNHGKGFFTVTTLDLSPAPSKGAIPFNYVIFNTASTGLFTVGSSVVPAGQPNAGVSRGGVTANSKIFLTVDATNLQNDVSLPGLKINNHGTFGFTVTTLGETNAPSSGVPFNYLIVNDDSCFIACAGTIAARTPNVGVSTTAVSTPSLVFLTVDITTFPNDAALPGIKVNNHGSGFFTVTTEKLTSTHTTTIPFNFVVFIPQAKWEEYGPTSKSGKVWSTIPDPVDWRIQYTGSSGGGVWKTIDGGDTWSDTWAGQRQAMIMWLVFAPGSRTTLFALGYDGTVYRSDDSAGTWTQLAQPAPLASDQGGALPTPSESAFLAVTPGPGQLFACSNKGLYSAPVTGASWTLFEPTTSDGSSPHQCSDVVYGRDGNIYAGFRDIGVWQRAGATWKQIKKPLPPATSPNCSNIDPCGLRPVRIAVGQNKIVLNYDCLVFLANLSQINSSAMPFVEFNWFQRLRNVSVQPGAGDYRTGRENRVCGDAGFATQGGYAMAVGLSPTNENHYVVFGNDGYVTFDTGTSFFPNKNVDTSYICGSPPVPCDHLDIGQDDHQAVFWDDNTVIVSTDAGPRTSFDGGKNWREAATASRITDGPPIKEYYDLSVSRADQFGRVFVGGNAQDSGAVFLVGRPTGIVCCGGEAGLTQVSPRPINQTSTQNSIFRYYSEDDQAPNLLTVCDPVIPGPDYLTPSGFDLGSWPYPDKGGFPDPCNPASPNPFPSPIWVIAVHPVQPDLALVGTFDGTVMRSISGTNGLQFEKLFDPFTPGDTVTGLYFSHTDEVYIGYGSGTIRRVSNPFGTSPSVAATSQPATGEVFAFTSTGTQVFAAYRDRLVRSVNNGSSWQDVTGSPLASNITGGASIVGLAVDTLAPAIYLATGHTNWFNQYAGAPAVWKAATSPVAASLSWTSFGQGLPNGLRITGLGLSPGRALYISTQGRGIWWRRDVAAVPPNSGVSAPADGAVRTGGTQIFVTTCSFPSGWHDIHTIDFKLAMGSGPEEGEPFSLWVEFDQDRNVLRFYDPDTGTWSEGDPGSNAVLSSRFAQLNLAASSVQGHGPTDPTVDITWSITFFGPADQTDLQQFLQVADDFGNVTTWDRVGSFAVIPDTFVPIAVRNASNSW